MDTTDLLAAAYEWHRSHWPGTPIAFSWWPVWEQRRARIVLDPAGRPIKHGYLPFGTAYRAISV